MSACLLLSCEDGSRKIVECPTGADPEDIAERNGAKIYEFCESSEEAERRLSNDPNGKMDAPYRGCSSTSWSDLKRIKFSKPVRG